MWRRGPPPQLVDGVKTPLCAFRYLDDLYELELQTLSGVRGWNIPEAKGSAPSPRESHTAVAYSGLGSPKLYIFGGMQGSRLNDTWQLDLGKPSVLDRIFLQNFL